MTFRVGQKVCCIRGLPEEEVIQGHVYTINAIEVFNGKTYVGLVEVKFKSGLGSSRCPWYADRFRPIVERKTDISIFQHMLLPQGENADA